MQYSTSAIPQFVIMFTIITTSFTFGSSISYNPLLSLTSMQCDSANSPICLNGGACLDLSKFVDKPGQNPQMSCYCPKKYFGPHCEYASKESFSRIDRSVRRRPTGSSLEKQAHSCSHNYELYLVNLVFSSPSFYVHPNCVKINC